MKTTPDHSLAERSPDSECVQLISAERFAEMIEISQRTLWRWLSARRVPVPIKVGGTVRWRLQEIKDWIAGGCQPPIHSDNLSRRKA